MDLDKLPIKDRKIIVGIDFGTTYSGIAWAETQNADKRVAVTTWPISESAREGEYSGKVPTKLRYADNCVQWGFSIPVNAPSDEVIDWFKLDLDASLLSVDQIMKKLSRGGRNAETLTTDYLSALGKHLMYMLREKLGDSFLKSTPLDFVVTVPAIWSDLAKDKTKKACRKALALSATEHNIHLVSEPEAAAIYALHERHHHGLMVNDTIVVVDAGGGTVDLISYTITGLQPILQVREAAPGSGARCGSTFINTRFAEFLKGKLGKKKAFDDQVLSDAMEVFENKIKRQFTLSNAPEETFTIPVAGLANNESLGIKRNRLNIKASDLQDIFEPIVLKVISLIKDQITASRVPVMAVLLVGGFGSSNYLKERLRNSIDRRIQILQPPNAWQAVVQGAVMKGLANSVPEHLTMVLVQNRKARKHYGIEWSVPFDKSLHSHLRRKRYWCGFDGCYKVNTMNWFIVRGDSVSENQPFFISLCGRGLVSDGRFRKVKTIIYSDYTIRDAPIDRDDDVYPLSKLEADVSYIPERKLSRLQGKDGQWYYELDYQIEAVYLSASTTYTLLHNDKRYGTVTCEYV